MTAPARVSIPSDSWRYLNDEPSAAPRNQFNLLSVRELENRLDNFQARVERLGKTLSGLSSCDEALPKGYQSLSRNLARLQGRVAHIRENNVLPQTHVPFLNALVEDLHLNYLSFLNSRDLANFGCSNRYFHCLSKMREAMNPEMLIASGLRTNGQFRCIYNYNFDAPGYSEDTFLTRQTVVEGRYLVVWPSLTEGNTLPNILRITDLQTGEEYRWDLDKRLEGCYVVTQPEPALALANRQAGVKIVNLKDLLRNRGAPLSFEDLPTFLPCEEDSPNPPVVTTEGSLVAIGYADHVLVKDLCDKKSEGISLPFNEAHQVIIRDKQVLCLSDNECMVFSIGEPKAVIGHYRSENSEFRFARFCSSSQIAIAYRNEIPSNLGSDLGPRVGVVYDCNTQKCLYLHDHLNMRGQYPLNCLAEDEAGTHLYGASDRFSKWDIEDKPEAQDGVRRLSTKQLGGIWDARIHTLARVSDLFISATNRMMFLHPASNFDGARCIENKLFDREKGREASDRSRYQSSKIVAVQIQGQYLIVEFAKWNFRNRTTARSIKVFDLLPVQEANCEEKDGT